MSAIYLEGGGDSSAMKAGCREGFSKLLARCNFAGRMPRLIACGGREAAFDRFKTALGQAHQGEFIALLIDSEDPIKDIEATWAHLKGRDGWGRPKKARDEQVLLMTTCMEAWIVADREALSRHYPRGFRTSALPTQRDLESRPRSEILAKLTKATEKCPNAYSKGFRSFEVLAVLDPAILKQYLPSFARMARILDREL